MQGAKFKQLFHPGSQVPVTHGAEVVEGEEVEVLGQVTRQAVELVPHPEGHTEKHTDDVRLCKENNSVWKVKKHEQAKTSYSLAKRHVLKRFFM